MAPNETASLPTPSKSFTIHSSFSELINLYDGFILDQFGVMHNGKHAIEGAVDCVSTLAKQSGKKLVILSNTSSSSEATLAKLPRLGFDQNDFFGAVTSGEEASRFVCEEYGKKKAKVLWITWSQSRNNPILNFLSKCGDIQMVENVDEADFILAHGSDVIRGPERGDGDEVNETSLGNFFTEEDYSVLDPVLNRCKERGLTMVCANPDFIMVNPDGSTANMPGKIAQRYESMGGKCTYFGKPHVPHFEACIKQLGLPKDRVAHVGDSLHHDIAGANASGIDSIFVAGGVHREEIGGDLGDVPDKTTLSELFDKEGGHIPTHVVPMLRLG